MHATGLFMRLLNIATFITATNSCCGNIQTIYLSVRSSNSTYDKKAATECLDSNNLCVILMGNTGVNFDLIPEFGWDTGMGSEGTLSVKRYIPDGKSINPGDLKFEWLPLNMQFDLYANLAMTTFGRKDEQMSAIRGPPRLTAAADGTLAMVAQDASDQPLDRWYVCGLKLVWALGRAAPENLTCSKVSLVKVSKL